MLLAIDIGNTNIVLGVFKGKQLKGEWRIATSLSRTTDEYGILLLDLFHAQGLAPKDIIGIALSSVVPPLTPVFEEMGRKYLGRSPMVVTHESKTGLRIHYEQPKDVGADRIVNAAAAFALYGGPLVIVDFGTATTFCAVSKEGDYLGGAIAPGLMISAEALFARAAKLPKVELLRPKNIIGRDTVSSMQAGIIIGYVGLVDELVTRIKQEVGGKPFVVATGGLAGLIVPESKTIKKIEPFLTLEGLRIIYQNHSD
jgi:type III pantothenate kinase